MSNYVALQQVGCDLVVDIAEEVTIHALMDKQDLKMRASRQSLLARPQPYHNQAYTWCPQ